MIEQSPTGQPIRYVGGNSNGGPRADHGVGRPAPRDSLVDLLDRVLDKGVVIAGDISISLLDIELLTIKIRLLIASADKAKEMGIDWWAHDPQLSSEAKRRAKTLDSARENKELRGRIDELESRLTQLLEQQEQGGAPQRAAALPAGRKGAQR